MASSGLKQKTCIFCGDPNLTKEHIWADWLKGYIPKNRPKHGALHGVRERSGHLTHRVKPWGGDSLNKQLRVVCGATKKHSRGCNNTWMSDLQNAARKTIIDLVQGNKFILTAEAQKVLARWATMTLMVAEWIDPVQVAVPYSEREYLRITGNPPDNWRIWIARYARHNWARDWVHRSVRVSDVDIPNPLDPTLPLPNTQFSTIIVGELYVHAISCELYSIIKDFNFEPWTNNLLIPIWPKQQAAVFWPIHALSDNQAVQIAEYGMDLFDRIARTFGI